LTDRRETGNQIAFDGEMFGPHVSPRVEQRNELPADLRRDVRALVEIAPMARKTKVCFVVGSDVLSVDYVLDMERVERELILVTAAILAPIPGTSVDKLTEPASIGMIVRASCLRQRSFESWPGAR
jgi:hypothetical protein